MILALLWLLPIVTGEQSEDDLSVSTRQTVVPHLLFLTGAEYYDGYYDVDGLHLLSSARPEYQHAVYDWKKIKYDGDVWTIGYNVFRNPAQTQLPPVSGWVLLYNGSPRPDTEVPYPPGYLSSPPEHNPPAHHRCKWSVWLLWLTG